MFARGDLIEFEPTPAFLFHGRTVRAEVRAVLHSPTGEIQITAVELDAPSGMGRFTGLRPGVEGLRRVES